MLIKLAEFLQRGIVAMHLLLKFHKEPFGKVSTIIKYVFSGRYYPDKKYVTIDHELSVTKNADASILHFRGMDIYYDKDWSSDKIIQNFNAIYNEQTIDSPHKYLSADEIVKDWVIYDFGPAEGYQSKLWCERAKHIYLFEPDVDFYHSLLQTFKTEIENNKVTVFNVGVSNENKDINVGNKLFKLHTLDFIVKEFNLPVPNYMKVDIEGEEMKFLSSALAVLKNEAMEVLQITVYHRPEDYVVIEGFLKPFFKRFNFNDGVVFFNRNGMLSGSYKKVYHPMIRKSLLTCSNI